MCIVDVYLVPLLLSYYGAILCTCAYCSTHKGIVPLMFIWMLIIVATVLYLVRRKIYKEEHKKN